MKFAFTLATLFLASLPAFANYSCELYCLTVEKTYISNGVDKGFDAEQVTADPQVRASGETRREALEATKALCEPNTRIVENFTTGSYGNEYLRWDGVLKTHTAPNLRTSCHE